MRPLPRILLSSAACALILAPGLLAHRHTKQSGAPVQSGASSTLGDSGFGAGMWIPATNELGFLSARLYDGDANLRYSLRANLVPGGPSLPGMNQQGGFLGVLLAVDAKGGKSVVAQVSGKWVRYPNGWAEFDVEVLVPSGDKNQPLASIGVIQGSMLPPGLVPAPDSGADTVAGEKDEAPASGEVVLMWSIPAAGVP
ncbi:MAG: hypothetical protein ACKVXR_05700 [Planctomycetota bacterium]